MSRAVPPEVYKARLSTSTGIYTSPVIFQGTWEDEIETYLAKTPFTHPEMEVVDKVKGHKAMIFVLSKVLMAHWTWNQTLTDEGFWDEEIPEDYNDTDAYYSFTTRKNH